MSNYFTELKEYLKFDDVDHQALRQLHPIAEPYFGTIAQDFYDRLQNQPNAMEVFRSEEQVLRLKATLARWMGQLLSGPWDHEYFEMRSRIGKVHVQIKLPQHFMFSAMAVIQEHLMGIASENLSPGDAEAASVGIQKITNIDLAIMLESYRVHFVDQVQAFERTEMHSLESKLEQTEALYRSIFESSGVAIMVVDGQHKVRLFNSMAESVTGYSRQRVTGRSVFEKLVHPHDRDAMQELLKGAARGQPHKPRELRLVAFDTSDKWIRWHATSIEGSEDVCVLGADVTRERKLAVQTSRVETLAALGTLAAGLAHEIRNPLNAAQLQLMLVERAVSRAGDTVDARALDSSALVKAELHRLAGLVEDFLAFARPTDLRVDNADLSGLCQGLVTFLEADAKAKGVTLSGQFEADVVARVDSEKLKQVLLNLVRNGIEAAGAAGNVTLRCRRIGQSVFLDVLDSGDGVPTDIDIFEPFATSKESGTGLGLPIVHRIITDHEGTIDHSRADGITSFTVELPIDGPQTSLL